MKELINTKSALFTECQNSIPSSKIFAFEYGRVWRKLDFSNINLYYKNIAKIGPNNHFLEPKMVLDLILMVFRVSLWFVSYKTQKYPVVIRFHEILSKNRPIFAENGSRDLKSRYLGITFFYGEGLKIVLET